MMRGGRIPCSGQGREGEGYPWLPLPGGQTENVTFPHPSDASGNEHCCSSLTHFQILKRLTNKSPWNISNYTALKQISRYFKVNIGHKKLPSRMEFISVCRRKGNIHFHAQSQYLWSVYAIRIGTALQGHCTRSFIQIFVTHFSRQRKWPTHKMSLRKLPTNAMPSIFFVAIAVLVPDKNRNLYV